MAEELRIIVKDEGGRQGGGASGPGAQWSPGGATQPGGQPGGATRPGGGGNSFVTILAEAASDISPVAATVVTAFSAVAVGVTAAVAAVAAMAFAAKKWAATIASQAETLAGRNASIANAVANSEVQRDFAATRRANAIGPQLAAAERFRSRQEIRLFDINTQILDAMLQITNSLGPFIEIAVGLLETVVSWLGRVFNEWISPILDKLEELGTWILEILQFLKIVEKKQDNSDQESAFTEEFLKLTDDKGRAVFHAGPIPAPGV